MYSSRVKNTGKQKEGSAWPLGCAMAVRGLTRATCNLLHGRNRRSLEGLSAIHKKACIIHMALAALGNALAPRAIMLALTTLSRYGRQGRLQARWSASRQTRKELSIHARPRRGAPMARAINLHSSFWHVSRGGRERYLPPHEICRKRFSFAARISQAHARETTRERREREREREREKLRQTGGGRDVRLRGTSGSSDDWSMCISNNFISFSRLQAQEDTHDIACLLRLGEPTPSTPSTAFHSIFHELSVWYQLWLSIFPVLFRQFRASLSDTPCNLKFELSRRNFSSTLL